MRTSTVNISFQTALLAEIDEVARREARSRSELLREAARMYVERKKRWEQIFEFGRKLAARTKLTPADLQAEIAARRRRNSGRR